jgi:hypothetical protein
MQVMLAAACGTQARNLNQPILDRATLEPYGVLPMPRGSDTTDDRRAPSGAMPIPRDPLTTDLLASTSEAQSPIAISKEPVTFSSMIRPEDPAAAPVDREHDRRPTELQPGFTNLHSTFMHSPRP